MFKTLYRLNPLFNNLEKKPSKWGRFVPQDWRLLNRQPETVSGCRLSDFYVKGMDMHPELIRAEIRMRGKTLTDLARLYDVSPKVVSMALKQPSLAGEKAIATFLNKSLHELFPERWTQDGRRIRPRYRYLYEEAAV
ncbi:hypothetical protein GCWU000324_02323 [Kingella oralis ATCC 51147]|jgi:hypothetical protein|uniref:Ner winged helix-turn-helix DNA-binding domain-containing protein n=2 Tax=Kingella TaxID=32257 RepID=C4GJV0_9NEIS|nr:hypothetical protein GCWU000324_02323 [Kingella oralis ATCC 51147]DAF21266.1 MAG TPA: winged helix-turn-helix DNA-binding protein [Caudoviricetes sp.]DAK34968.1 MAG TPA: winged helix-turn-helix DNA-binding protein [Caudoviricetes sp.]DAU43167.1 MAG TPA: winged helix-turn-helix DNA-binding protein [Caudoviricetes sp.]DAU98451.1 MAG TPA: winged helix-turn-helix DNA-binding protein [Caudoviricetes sp.]